MLNFYDGHKVYMNGDYPAIFLNGKNAHVHRLEWIKHQGEIPEGFVVHHKDENKLNWNIENLHYEGSHKFGEKSRHHKLTQEQVDYIRKVYVKYDKTFGGRALAEEFNVTPQCISRIVRGHSWGGVGTC